MIKPDIGRYYKNYTEKTPLGRMAKAEDYQEPFYTCLAMPLVI